MFEAIGEAGGPDLKSAWLDGDETALEKAATEAGVERVEGLPPGVLLASIFEAVAERKLTAPTFVVGFPKDVSPLAKDHREIPGFTEHADLVVGGVEMAPVYSELNDPILGKPEKPFQLGKIRNASEIILVFDGAQYFNASGLPDGNSHPVGNGLEN